MASSANQDEIDMDNPPFPLTAIDRSILAMKDEDFHVITWSDLDGIIRTNNLEALKRRPTDLRRYLAWSHRTKQAHGSITKFVVQERLRWTPNPTPPGATAPIQPSFSHHSTTPFANELDYAVLKNDWPYGLAPDVHHLLVWTKTPIAVDMSRGGDVTPESRVIIEEFVQRFFVADVGVENVLWFKNWVALQSVRGVDHVHVMVRGVSPAILEKWCVRKDI